MNETVTETAATDFDDWSDIVLDEGDVINDETDTGEQTDTAETAQNDDAGADQSDDSNDEQQEAEESGKNEEFTLKHLDETKTVSRDEVISLAQRGLDYDRVREKLTAASEQLAALQGADEKLSFFKELADSQGKTLDQFIEATAAALRAREKQIPFDEALKEVQFDFEKRKFAKEKTDWEKKQSDRQSADDSRNADIEAFMTRYPDAAKDPQSIPKEVWEDVDKNGSLVDAYGRYLDKQKDAKIAELTRQLEQQKQHNANKQRSTGSQSTDNSSAADQLFDSYWKD